MAIFIMAANNQSGMNASGWTKWQIALAIGAPVAVGLGYWYLKSSRHKLKRFGSTESDDNSVKEDAEHGIKSGSKAKTDKILPKPQDPIERAQAMKNKGNKLFKGGKYEDAIKCYTEAINVCPQEQKNDIATFYQNRAAAYEQLKKYEEVINDCSKALDLNCKYCKALNRRAKAFESSGELQKCLEDVTAVCILEGFQNQSSLLMADRVLKQLGRDRAQNTMKNREPVLPSNNFIKSYFSSFTHDPVTTSSASEEITNEETLSGYLKAKHDLLQQRYENIIKDCTEEINKPESPYIIPALLLRGTFYILYGQTQSAHNDLEKVINTEDADIKAKVNALIKVGSLQIQEERPDKALASFETAEKLDPNNADIYHHRGQLNLLMERMEEAVQDFNKAVKLNSEFPITYVQKCYADYRYAFLKRNQDGVQKAIECFEQATKKFPNCVEGYTLYGQALADRQEFAKADECFEKALKQDPDNANIYVHKGLLQLQWKQDVNKAVSLINEAIKKDDKCEFGYETLGTIEVQRGKLERAIELFGKAIALSKTEAEMAHLYSLNDAAVAQARVAKRLNIPIPSSA